MRGSYAYLIVLCVGVFATCKEGAFAQEASLGTGTVAAIEKAVSNSVSYQVGLITQQLHKAINEIVNPNIPPQFLYLEAGFISLNPYTITKTEDKFTIDDASDTDSSFYIGVIFRHRGAWLYPEDRLKYKKSGCNKTLNRLGEIFLAKDFEVKFGFANQNEKATASTIAGAGESFAEGSLGWPIVESEYDTNNNIATTFNFELLGGLTTDSEFQDIHDYYGAGFASIWGIGLQRSPDGKAPNDRRKVEIIVGGYYGVVETPEFVGDDRTLKSSNGFVDFENQEAVLLRADFRIPDNNRGYFSLGGRYWAGLDDLNPWSITIGYSYPLGAKK